MATAALSPATVTLRLKPLTTTLRHLTRHHININYKPITFPTTHAPKLYSFNHLINCRAQGRCFSVSAIVSSGETLETSKTGEIREFKKRLRIVEIKGGENEGLDNLGKVLTVRGWVRTLRVQSSVTFIEFIYGISKYFNKRGSNMKESHGRLKGEDFCKYTSGGYKIDILITLIVSAILLLAYVYKCFKPEHVLRMSEHYLQNVALKINVKVGGRNNVLSAWLNRRLPYVTDRPTIIFGADVTHPQPGEDSSPSIAAVVASMDWPEVTKYKALVSAQPHRQETIQDLYTTRTDPKRGVIHGGLIRELLMSFKKATGHKPDRLIFYRDGVSEGQFSEVLLNEMDKIH